MPANLPLRNPAIGPGPTASGALVDVVVLSEDVELFDAIRDAIGERNPVWRARSPEESADLLLSGRCGVLLVDLATVVAQPDSLIQRIVEQFPDVVVCVAGRRDDEPLLAPLISDGHVYRFMHKPLSPRRAGMFLQAAIRQHWDRRDALKVQEASRNLVAQLPERFELLKWVFVALIIGLLVLVIDAAFAPRAPLPDPGSPTAAPATVSTPPATVAAASERADPVLSRARAALQAGRYESPPGRNALDLFKAVLLSQPQNAEAQAGLDQAIDQILAHAREALDAGDQAEAQRLVDRALEADPGRRTAVLLAQRMKKLNEPAAAATAPVPAAEIAAAPEPAIPVAPTLPVATAPAPTPLPGPVTRLPPVDTPSVAKATTPSEPIVVRPDPLAPRYSNATAPAPARPRIYARTVTPLPTAGYVKPDPADTRTDATAAEASVTAAPPSGPVLPSDSFERLVVTDPVYPAQALRNRTTGWVELEFTIAPSGNVGDITVVDAQPRGVFEQSARTALSHWRFRPRVVNGQPVAQRSTITMRFDVDD